MRELLVLAALLAAPLAHGWRIVLDPSNLAQNAIHAAQAVQQTRLLLESAERELRQVRGLGGGAVGEALAPHEGELREVAAAVRAVRNLHGSVQQMRDALGQRLQEAREYRMTWQQYMAHEEGRILKNQAAAIARAQEEVRILERVQADYEFARAMEPRIAATEGSHQALQLMNVQMNRLLTQTAELSRALVTSIGQAQSAERAAQENVARQQQLTRDRAMEELRRARIEGDLKALELFERR